MMLDAHTYQPQVFDDFKLGCTYPFPQGVEAYSWDWTDDPDEGRTRAFLEGHCLWYDEIDHEYIFVGVSTEDHRFYFFRLFFDDFDYTREHAPLLGSA